MHGRQFLLYYICVIIPLSNGSGHPVFSPIMLQCFFLFTSAAPSRSSAHSLLQEPLPWEQICSIHVWVVFASGNFGLNENLFTSETEAAMFTLRQIPLSPLKLQQYLIAPPLRFVRDVLLTVCSKIYGKMLPMVKGPVDEAGLKNNATYKTNAVFSIKNVNTCLLANSPQKAKGKWIAFRLHSTFLKKLILCLVINPGNQFWLLGKRGE